MSDRSWPHQIPYALYRETMERLGKLVIEAYAQGEAAARADLSRALDAIARRDAEISDGVKPEISPANGCYDRKEG